MEPSETAAQHSSVGRSDSRGRVLPMGMLGDRPVTRIDQDVLGSAVYVEALAELIDSEGTQTPFTIAVNGPWGSGKSSVVAMVEERLHRLRDQLSRPRHLVTWFNAWRHDDAPHLGAALAAHVARFCAERRPLLRGLTRPLPAAMLTGRGRLRRRLTIGVVALGVALAAAVWLRPFLQPGQDVLDELNARHGAAVATILVGVWTLLAAFGHVHGAAQAAARFVDKPASEAALGSMEEVRTQLGGYIHGALRGRRLLVVVIDDLERCRPERAVELCEVSNLLLAQPGVVTIFLADLPAIAAAVEVKYQAVAERYHARLGGATGRAHGGADERDEAFGAYGFAYLQKVVQFQFDLPPPLPGQLRDLVDQSIVRPVTAEAGDDVRLPAAGAGGGDRPGRLQRLEDWGRKRPDVYRDWKRRAGEAIAGARDDAILAGRVLRVGGLVVGIWFSGLIWIGSADEPPAWAVRALNWATLGAFGLLLLGALGVFGWARLVRRNRRRRLERAEGVIRASVGRGAGRAAVEAQAVEHLKKGDDPAAVAPLIDRAMVEDSRLRTLAEAFVVENLPANPRSVKRLLNRLRFNLFVAIRHSLYDDGDADTARRIGKWVVLQERWPGLGWAMANDPGRMPGLEKAAAGDEAANLRPLLADLVPPIPWSEELASFLRQEPRFGDEVGRFIHLRPVAG